MNKHIFLYTLKTFFKNKSVLFWHILFPILLVTFMHIAFSGLTDHIKTIPIAIESKELSAIFKKINYKNTPLFDVNVVKSAELPTKLQDKTIAAYISGETAYSLQITENNISTDTIKTILNQINHKKELIQQLLLENNGEKKEEILNAVLNSVQEKKLETINIGSSENNTVNITLFSVLTMAAMFSALTAISMVDKTLQSIFARRQLLGCISKFKILISAFTTNLFYSIFCTLVSFAYMILILKIFFGPNLFLTLAVSTIGTITGFLMGTTIGVLFKGKVKFKENLALFISLFAGFCSGLMLPNVTYYLNSTFPLLRNFNPSYLITDSFYALYFYENFDRLLSNLQKLGLINLVFIALILFAVRRKKNEYI